MLLHIAIWLLRRLTSKQKLSHYDVYSNPRYGKVRG